MVFTNFQNGVTSFGIPQLGNGDIPTGGEFFFVHSGSGNNGYDGSWDTPFATIDYAIGRCSASVGSVIIVKPGHAETLASAGAITADIAGVTVVGLGHDANRPVLTFGTLTTASVLVTAANVSFLNIVGVAGIDSLANPFHIQASGCTLDIEWRDDSSTVEAVRAILTTAAADRLKVRLRYRGQTAGDACVNAVRLVGCNGGDIVIDAYGKASTSWVEFHTTACTDVSVRGRMYNSGTTDGSKNVIDTVTGSTWDADIFDSTAGAPYSGGSGSTLAKDDLSAVTDALYGANGVASWPTAAAYGNAVSIAEVLGYIQDAVRRGTGTTLAANTSLQDVIGTGITGAAGLTIEAALGTTGTVVADSATSVLGAIGANNANNAFGSGTVAANHDGSVLERLEALAQGAARANMNFNSPNYFVVTADMTSATWNTVASHQIAAVTGMVQMTVIPQCTDTLTDAADGASIQLGITGTTNAIIASTGAAGAGAATISTNEFWVDATPADVIVTGSQVDALSFIVGGGIDVGYEITGAALTGGTLLFHVWWTPLDATGAVAAGTGGALA